MDPELKRFFRRRVHLWRRTLRDWERRTIYRRSQWAAGRELAPRMRHLRDNVGR